MRKSERKNMTLNEILLINIIHFIEMYGMSESECLGECGIHSNFISNLRSGKLKKPSLEDVYKIAVFFKISIDQLICYMPQEGEPEIKEHKRREARIFYNMYRSLDFESKQIVNETIRLEKTKNNRKNHTNYKIV